MWLALKLVSRARHGWFRNGAQVLGCFLAGASTLFLLLSLPAGSIDISALWLFLGFCAHSSGSTGWPQAFQFHYIQMDPRLYKVCFGSPALPGRAPLSAHLFHGMGWCKASYAYLRAGRTARCGRPICTFGCFWVRLRQRLRSTKLVAIRGACFRGRGGLGLSTSTAFLSGSPLA
jgi:hypothetical protein